MRRKHGGRGRKQTFFFYCYYSITFSRGDGSSCVPGTRHRCYSWHGPSQAGELIFDCLKRFERERERRDEVEFFFSL